MINREEIEAAFGELLDLIQDKDLAAKAVDTWMLGIEEGRWQSLAQLQEAPFTLVSIRSP